MRFHKQHKKGFKKLFSSYQKRKKEFLFFEKNSFCCHEGKYQKSEPGFHRLHKKGFEKLFSSYQKRKKGFLKFYFVTMKRNNKKSKRDFINNIKKVSKSFFRLTKKGKKSFYFLKK